jgi:pimeloyl-ACP methyl ester carboxylesterase
VRVDDFRILLLAPAVYLAVVGAGVVAGVGFCAWAKRGDVMDEHQASVFGCVRVTLAHRAWALLVETVYQAISLVLRTLHAWRLLPQPRGAPECTPVLIVPGYTENAGTMLPLGFRLARAGFNPILIDFPSTLHRIESNAEFLARRIAQVREVTGASQVAIVAHSMGGLITRTLLHTREDHGVIAFEAIASPYRGTHLARLGAPIRLGHCLTQMCPGSEFMRRFPPTLPARVPMLSMITCQENIISPEWSAVVVGAETRVLSEPWGHQAPLFMSEVYLHVERWLLAHGVTRAVSPAPHAGSSTAST